MRWNSLNRSRYYHIYKIIAEKGHNVHVLQPPPINKSRDTGFIKTEEEHLPNIHYHDLDINSLIWNAKLPFDKIFKKGYLCLKINRSLNKMVREHKIDVIMFYNMALYPVTKIQDIISIYDLDDDHVELIRNELGRFNNNLLISLAEKVMKNVIKKTDIVLSVSQFLADKYYPESIFLPNGVDPAIITPGCGKELRNTFKKPVIGFIGSLEYFINFDLIIEAASRLREYTFVIAGGGREHERILKERDRLQLNNLVITGGMPHEKILEHIDSFDICLNMFKKSQITDAACPIKLFEYMAFKKPVVSTRINEVQRIDKGFVYWADTVDELIMRIDEIMSNSKLVKEKVEIGYELLLKNYTWPILADRLINIIDSFKQSQDMASQC